MGNLSGKRTGGYDKYLLMLFQPGQAIVAWPFSFQRRCDDMLSKEYLYTPSDTGTSQVVAAMGQP